MASSKELEVARRLVREEEIRLNKIHAQQVADERAAYETAMRQQAFAKLYDYVGEDWIWNNSTESILDEMWDIAQQMCSRDYHGDIEYDHAGDNLIQLFDFAWAVRKDTQQR